MHAPRRVRFGILIASAAGAASGCGHAAAPPDTPAPAAEAAPAALHVPAGPMPVPASGSLVTPSDRPTLLEPLEVAAFPDGPVVVLLRRPASELATVRLSVPLTGAYERIGIARVLARLVEPRLLSAAAAAGMAARVDVGEDAIAITVTGPADLEELVTVARLGVSRPEVVPAALNEAVHRVEAAALAESELPSGLARRQLGAALFPLVPTRGGDAATVRSLTPDAVRAFWREFHRPDRMHAVVVGPWPMSELAPLFGGWHVPEAVAGTDREIGPPAEGGTQTVRPWLGAGYLFPDEYTAELQLARRFIARSMRSRPGGSAQAEVWWRDGATALVVFAVGEAGTPTDTLERLVRSAVLDLRRVDPASADREATALGEEFLLAARTSEGAAAVIGDLFDRTGDAHAAAWYLVALRSLDGASLYAIAERIERARPTIVRVEP